MATILVLDEEPGTRRSIARRLVGEGHAVVAAATLEEALAALRRRAAAPADADADGHTTAPQRASRLDLLTPRERQVFLRVAEGATNRQIAGDLHLSVATVKKHRENLQRKLDLHSGAAIARVAIREGLLSV
jgi:DNA-binding NarL/FixJ family response regulator